MLLLHTFSTQSQAYWYFLGPLILTWNVYLQFWITNLVNKLSGDIFIAVRWVQRVFEPEYSMASTILWQDQGWRIYQHGYMQRVSWGLSPATALGNMMTNHPVTAATIHIWGSEKNTWKVLSPLHLLKTTLHSLLQNHKNIKIWWSLNLFS